MENYYNAIVPNYVINHYIGMCGEGSVLLAVQPASVFG